MVERYLVVIAALAAGCGVASDSTSSSSSLADAGVDGAPADLADSAASMDAGASDGVVPSDLGWPSTPDGGFAGPVITPRTNINATLAVGAQGESDIAIDPTNTPYFNHLIAAATDSASAQVIAYETNDGATSWSTHALLLPMGFVGATAHGTVAFDAAGNGLVSLIASDATTSTIALARRPAGSGSWGRLALLSGSANVDRQRITVDRSATSPRLNTIYLAWTDGTTVRVAASIDGGVSFGAGVPVNDGGEATSPYPTVDADGTVYVAWLDGTHAQLRIDRSTDGGASWGTDHVVHSLAASGLTAATVAAPTAGVRLAPFCDADRAKGANHNAIYCAYHDVTPAEGLDVYLRRSLDGGSTWSSPRRMSDDPSGTGADQFLPRVQIDDGDGKVSVAWYDTRDDPAHQKTNVYFTRANDGVSFVTSVRVTTAMTDESRVGADPAGYGESLGLEAFDGRARVMWTDSRSGDEEQFSCIVDFAHFSFFFPGSDTIIVPPGGSGQMSVSVQPVGPFTASVQLSLLGMPASASSSWSVNPVSPNGTSLVGVTALGVAAGTYSVSLKGIGGGEEDSRPITLVVQ